MFTSNPKFKPPESRKNGVAKARQRQKELFRRHSVTPTRVVYIDSKRHFVPESSDILRRFLEMYKLPRHARIFHDKSHAFYENKRPVLDNYKICGHAAYPPCVHQVLSPNDNSYHGEAKRKWFSEIRKQGYGKDQDADAELLLLECLDSVDPKHIRHDFERNFFIGQKNVTTRACYDLVYREKNTKKAKIKEWKDNVKAFMKFQETACKNNSP